jgi:uncharacterized phage infection (PIP) family protein YhgE
MSTTNTSHSSSSTNPRARITPRADVDDYESPFLCRYHRTNAHSWQHCAQALLAKWEDLSSTFQWYLSDMGSERRELRAQVEAKDEAITQRDEEINELRKSLQNEVQAKNEVIAQRDAEINDLRDEVEIKDEVIAQGDAEIEELNESMQEMRREMAEKDDEIRGLKPLGVIAVLDHLREERERVFTRLVIGRDDINNEDAVEDESALEGDGAVADQDSVEDNAAPADEDSVEDELESDDDDIEPYLPSPTMLPLSPLRMPFQAVNTDNDESAEAGAEVFGEDEGDDAESYVTALADIESTEIAT